MKITVLQTVKHVELGVMHLTIQCCRQNNIIYSCTKCLQIYVFVFYLCYVRRWAEWVARKIENVHNRNHICIINITIYLHKYIYIYIYNIWFRREGNCSKCVIYGHVGYVALHILIHSALRHTRTIQCYIYTMATRQNRHACHCTIDHYLLPTSVFFLRSEKLNGREQQNIIFPVAAFEICGINRDTHEFKWWERDVNKSICQKRKLVWKEGVFLIQLWEIIRRFFQESEIRCVETTSIFKKSWVTLIFTFYPHLEKEILYIVNTLRQLTSRK